nr:FAD-binding oxidoreductase [Afifella sp. IM 167]
MSADVVIVGGGFCGLSAALHLAEKGREVVLLEARFPGWGASGRNGGQIVPGFRCDPDEVLEAFGPERGELLVRAAGEAPSLVFSLVERHDIDCDLRRTGWIHAGAGVAGLAKTRQRAAQWQRRGAPIELLDETTFRERTGAEGYAGGYLDRRGGRLNPVAYLQGLVRAAEAAGARIFSETPVQRVSASGRGWEAASANGSVTAPRLLLCTNAYSDRLWPRLRRSIVPVESTVIATAPIPPSLRPTILPEGQPVADTRRLISWFCVDGSGRLVLGGRNYRKLLSGGTWALDQRLRTIFPSLAEVPITHRWSGKVAITLDHLPHIHEPEPGVLAALGFNGRGVAMSTLLGRTLAARILGEEESGMPLATTPIREVPLHPLRFAGITAAVQFKRFRDWLD